MTRLHQGPAEGEGTTTDSGEWLRKGATLSDGTATREFGLTRQRILDAIRKGHLQYRLGSCHGNPFLRLLRREVEELVQREQGGRALEERKLRRDLAHVEREQRALRRQVAVLETKRLALLAALQPGAGAPRRKG